MLGKARLIFVSDLSSMKAFHYMWMRGETGNTRWYLSFAFGLGAILHLAYTTEAINQKTAQQNSYCDTGTSPNRVRLEASMAFTALFVLLYSMKRIQIHTLNEFRESGALRHPALERKAQRWTRAVNYLVQSAFNAFSNTMDSLVDREDIRKELENPHASKDHRSDEALHRSIEKVRKNLKGDVKGMLEQMQLSQDDRLKEETAKLQDFVTHMVTSAIADSHQLLLEAINQSENGNQPSRASIENTNSSEGRQLRREDDESETNSQFSVSIDEFYS